MIVQQKIGNLATLDLAGRNTDTLWLEWFEVNKRIMHKKAVSGREVVLKFLSAAPELTEGDVLWQDETTAIVVGIQPCEAIVIEPATMYQMASVCYEIGNKHLPLFYVENKILVPFESPLFKLLSAAGYEPKKEMRKLVNPLKSTVSPHGHVESKQSLFSKILQLTSSPANV